VCWQIQQASYFLIHLTLHSAVIMMSAITDISLFWLSKSRTRHHYVKAPRHANNNGLMMEVRISSIEA
jgi:hypothetical protein